MKLQMTPVFGGLVVGSGGISVSYANGTYTFSLAGAAPIQVSADAAVAAGTSAIAVVRVNPVLTIVTLPAVALQAGVPLSIFDWSTAIVNHEIRVIPFGAETIMRQVQWSINSVGAILGSATLRPASNLSGWYIA